MVGQEYYPPEIGGEPGNGSQGTDVSQSRPSHPRAKKLAETIMAKTRSRADPDALLNNSSSIEGIEKATTSMINVNSQEERRFIESTAVAKKRGHVVVKLLAIGLLAFLIAFLGGFLVLSSCHFVSVEMQVGENAEEYNIHFGLWKYSPVDSATQGYTYCSSYSGDVSSYVPWFGRICSLFALLGGGFSIGVLWLYLVFGVFMNHIWKVAVYTAAISGVMQASTLSILVSTICKEQVCTLGPAGMISIVAGSFYFVLACAMFLNSPLDNLNVGRTNISSIENPDQNLEMTNFEYGTNDCANRIGPTDSDGNSYFPPSAIV